MEDGVSMAAMESEIVRVVTEKEMDPRELQLKAVEASIAQMEAAGVPVPDTMKEALLSCCGTTNDDDLTCATCKLGVNGDEFVACDECNSLHHLGCVMLLEVPKGDWMCAT